MARLNSAFAKLTGNYLFAEIGRRVATYKEQHPDATIISLGIGDVSQPLVPAIVEAMHKAVDDMGRAETFKGYGPTQGYDFLLEKIIAHDFAARGVDISAAEIFVSDGAKCDVGNIQELFDTEAVIALADPVYPVYIDSNIMAGRGGSWDGVRWSELIYLPCTMENHFVPELPPRRPDIIYLCYPNNPTGTVLTKEQLTQWVNYARQEDAIILYDAAYESFISDPVIPRSIYEISGAKEVAIEFRSYSKKAGFTGVRCAYTVVPKELMGRTRDGKKLRLRDMWQRRQDTKFNGCSYIVQQGAAAAYSPEAQTQLQGVLDIYMGNARLIRDRLAALGMVVVGGEHSPYVWVKTPGNTSSWDFFDRVLQEGNVVCTPGVGFGSSGEGYVRFTAFASPENTREAVDRLVRIMS